jgi:SAM-dependent methyltransferase
MSSTRPAVYTHGHTASVLRSHTWRTAENSAAYLLPLLKPEMTILDVGCGPGTITADLAARVPQGHITGLDAAPDVLGKAHAHATERGVQNIAFAPGDVHALPFPDASFDVVHAHQVLQHITDPVQALREMRRVTRPGGLIAVRDVDYRATAWFPESPGLERWLDLYLRVARANGGAPDAGRRLHVWAREAGFDLSSTTCSAGTWCFRTLEEREWWGGLWADRVLHSNFAPTALGNGLATQEDLEKVSKAWKEWISEEDGWMIFVHGEILCRV